MSDGLATLTADKPAESYWHPAWCDLTECTWSDRGGAHHSAWMTLGPLSATNLVARAYLYFATSQPAPMAMVSFHYPVEDPEDIALNADHEEDTTSLVLPMDQLEHLDGFLARILALCKAGT